MKVLVTGTDGYIGSLLAPLLLESGHEVTGLDTGFYREGWLYTEGGSERTLPRTLTRDLRKVTRADLHGFEAVVHLAELSNDPLGETNPSVTYDINHRGSLSLAREARAAGVHRFVYASSCSVYGVGGGELMSEESPVNPQTAYARCKVLVERDLAQLAAGDFAPTVLRNATAFGASPRMRFDIVLNNLSGLAWTTNRISMTSDGTPWRPLVHALDIAQAISRVLMAPVQTVHNEVFNVGEDAQNYTVRDIATIVADVFPGCELGFGPPSPDNRSYRVSFDKIHAHLPEFRCAWDARAGAKQLREIFSLIKMTASLFQCAPFTRLKQLQHLLDTRQIDDDYYWRR